MVNKLSIISTVLNTKLKMIRETGNHVALLGSQFFRLAAMKPTIEEPKKVAILVASLSSFNVLAPLIASVNILLEL